NNQSDNGNPSLGDGQQQVAIEAIVNQNHSPTISESNKTEPSKSHLSIVDNNNQIAQSDNANLSLGDGPQRVFSAAIGDHDYSSTILKGNTIRSSKSRLNIIDNSNQTDQTDNGNPSLGDGPKQVDRHVATIPTAGQTNDNEATRNTTQSQQAEHNEFHSNSMFNNDLSHVPNEPHHNTGPNQAIR